MSPPRARARTASCSAARPVPSPTRTGSPGRPPDSRSRGIRTTRHRPGPTHGFSDRAALDDGDVWPVAYAVKESAPAEEERVAALGRRAVG
ncbi:hypothetical protein B6264_12430 [Kitasatospora aureofaciens]|nr:hypothetical protein B6264_12430 [Kitasatospora aureofaciens]QEV00799.1 hypothetical protein CP971_17435 [Streptomyces viridifaciens]